MELVLVILTSFTVIFNIFATINGYVDEKWQDRLPATRKLHHYFFPGYLVGVYLYKFFNIEIGKNHE